MRGHLTHFAWITDLSCGATVDLRCPQSNDTCGRFAAASGIPTSSPSAPATSEVSPTARSVPARSAACALNEAKSALAKGPLVGGSIDAEAASIVAPATTAPMPKNASTAPAAALPGDPGLTDTVRSLSGAGRNGAEAGTPSTATRSFTPGRVAKPQ